MRLKKVSVYADKINSVKSILEVTIVIQKFRFYFLTLLCLGLLSQFSSLSARNAPDSINVLTSVVNDAAQLQNKVVYVDFWASWCGPCRKSFPWLQTINSRLEEKGFKVLTINVDRDRAAAKKFLDEMKIPFEVVYDSTGALAEKFGLEAIPSSYLYGRDGQLHSVHRGFNPAKAPELEALINKLLTEGPKK